MAQTNRPYGKDNPERFISSALTGGSGKSNGIHERSCGRVQTLNTALPMDNVRLAMRAIFIAEWTEWTGLGCKSLFGSSAGKSL
jgi:hypothetical protein